MFSTLQSYDAKTQKSRKKSGKTLAHDLFFQNRWVEGLATDMFCHARASKGLGTAKFCSNQWIGYVETDVSTHARGSEALGTVRFPTSHVTKWVETVRFCPKSVGLMTWNCQVSHKISELMD